MIRVVVADDTLIAREGWKKILETVADIEVVGEATLAEGIPQELEKLKPDVLLMDLKWFDDKGVGIETIARVKQQGPEVRIIAITVYPPLARKARDAGADAVLPKGFSRSELVDAIRAVYQAKQIPIPWEKRAYNVAARYAERLRTIEPGRRDARRYEEFIEEVLSFLLEPHLTDLRAQSRTFEGTQIRDIIMFNGSNDAFWTTVRQKHGAAQVVFELKNVDGVNSSHILQLADYLKEPLGDFGIIITRTAPSGSTVRRVLDTYKAHNKLVLILSDIDIIAMLDARKSAGEPTDVIKRKYLDLASLI